jgi:hypothetical protein
MSRKLQYHQCKYGDGAKTQQQASYGLYFPATVRTKRAVSGHVIFAVLADHWRILGGSKRRQWFYNTVDNLSSQDQELSFKILGHMSRPDHRK